MSAFRARVREEVDRLGLGAGPVVVGVSGGVDSVVLARTLVALGVEVVIAHVDHGLRPDSTADAAWVEALAVDLGVPGETLRVRVGEGNVQAQARAARYDALGALAARVGSRVVAVAHTATDQAETVLLNLVRGSGLRGLAGMAPTRPLTDAVALVRPVLWASRAEIEAEAAARGWTWREDPTNATDRYRRNRIRHHVLPLLEDEGGPHAAARIARTAQIVRDAIGASEPGRVFQTHAVVDARGGHVPLSAEVVDLGGARGEVWVAALQAWAPDAPLRAEAVAAVDALVERPVGARVVLPGLVVWRERTALRFETSAPILSGETSAALGDRPTTIATEAGTLSLDPVPGRPATFDSDPHEEHVDAEALGETVTLRPWRDGDRFGPFGLEGSKLVSDLLTERRVPPSERPGQLVLCGGDGRIVWVLGHRLAAHAAVGPETTRTVRLRWSGGPIAAGGRAG